MMYLMIFLSIFSVMNGKSDPLKNLKDDQPNDDQPRDFRNELLKLNNLAESWGYTCNFCFKNFPSAQALGGHQNAHKNQRRELQERKVCVKDHINYKKRAFKKTRKSPEVAVASNGPKHAKFYCGDEGSSDSASASASAIACMAVNRKQQLGSSSSPCFHSESSANSKSVLPAIPVTKGEIKAEELDLTLKL